MGGRIAGLGLALFLGASVTEAAIAPYHETFEAEAPCATLCTESCPLGPSGWLNLGGDSADWLVDTNGTATFGTGPAMDHAPGLSNGRYLYLETSAPCATSAMVAELVSPPLELTGLSSPTVRFWYHHHGSDIGSLHVDVLDATFGDIANDVIPPIQDDVDAWQRTSAIDLSAFLAHGAVRIRIRGVHSGSGPFGDQAIDDFLFYDNAQVDLGLVAVASPGPAVCGDWSAVPIAVTLENDGGLVATGASIAYTIDGGPPVVEALGPIAPNASLTHTFATLADLGGAGPHTLSLSVVAPSDANGSNDVLVATIVAGSSYTVPFLETFEGPETHWFSGGENSSWARGTPNKTFISGAASGTTAWVTSLTGEYENDERSWVAMACPIDLTTIADPWLSLDVWWAVESSWDGAALQYSTDGVSWHTLGNVGSGVNWYNHAIISAEPGDAPQGWSGDFFTADSSGGWVKARHDLSTLAGETSVHFRLAFAADFVFTDDGFAFDDFEILSASALPAEVAVEPGSLPPAADDGAVPPGAVVPVVAIDLEVVGLVALDGITLHNPGTIADDAISWELWADSGDGAFDPEADVFLAAAPQLAGQIALAPAVDLGIGNHRLFALARLHEAALAGETFGAALESPSDLSFAGPASTAFTAVQGALASVGTRATTLPFDDAFEGASSSRWVRTSAGRRVPFAPAAGPVEGWSGPFAHHGQASFLTEWGALQSPDDSGFLALGYPSGPAVVSVAHAFDLSAWLADPIWLRYRHADLGDEADPEDHLFLSVDGGLHWQRSLTPLALPEAPNGMWIETTVDLSEALAELDDAGAHVLVALQSRDDIGFDHGDGLFLDHLRVGRAPALGLARSGLALPPEGTDELGATIVAVQTVHYEVENGGDFALELDDFELSASGAGALSLTGSTSVAPGTSGQLSVSFVPEEGVFTLAASLRSNDPRLADGAYRWFITGEASPAPSLVVRRGDGTVVPSGGLEALGSMDAPDHVLEYVVENQGTTPLVVTAIAVEALENATADTALASLTIEPGAESILTVAFAPVRAGPFTFGIRIDSNDPAEPSFRFTIAGERSEAVGSDCACLAAGAPARGGPLSLLLVMLAAARRWRRGAAILALSLVGCGAESSPELQATSTRVETSLAPEAGAESRLHERRSGATVRFRLEGASPVGAIPTAEGARYPGAFEGADLLVRRRDDGIEDWIVFATPPAEEVASWDFGFEGIAGLRLVEGVLELLDEAGAPRLRVARPHVVDANERRRPASLDVEGCRVDRDPAPPWGRAVVPPGAARCRLVVRWGVALGEPIAYPARLDPLWQDTASLHEPRFAPTLTKLRDGRILAVTAFNHNLTTTEIYDPATGTWAVSGNLVVPSNGHTATLLPDGQRVLVTGGLRASDFAPLERMEIWEDGIFRAVGGLPEPRVGHGACLLADGRVLIAGGAGAFAGPLLGNSVLFDPTIEAISIGPFTSFAHHAGTLTCLADGTAVIAGGLPGTAYVERFSPVDETWTVAGKLSVGRREADALLRDDGKVAFVAGLSVVNAVDGVLSVDLFDPAGEPELAAPLSSPHHLGFAALLADDRMLVGAGIGPSATVELYDPRNDEWFVVDSLPEARASARAVAITPHAVLVVGGINASGPLSTAFVYTLPENGASCLRDAECASYHCVEGRCCDAPCAGPCQSCLGAVHGGPDGQCDVVPAGVVDSGCEAEVGCGRSGACDGEGSCALATLGTPCEADCSGTCDGAGTCVCEAPRCSDDATQFGATACAPYICDDDGCRTSCQTSSECQAPHLCDRSGHCTLPTPMVADEGCDCRAAPGGDARAFPWLVGSLLLRRRRR
jgi:hypothetical protein